MNGGVKMKLAELLQKIVDDPEDLTELPGIIEKVSALEEDYSIAESKIGKLHELNRKYLKMIPINDETEPEEKKPEPVTTEQAVKAIMKGAM